MNVDYSHTNENLTAIISGLALREKDKVLAIGGSGDQAFAMLEFADSVVVVDNSERQINYIRLRTKFLENSEFDKFLGVETTGSKDWLLRLPGDKFKTYLTIRNEYFESKGRLEKIRAKLCSLDVRDRYKIEYAIVDERDFDKYYLSNAFVEEVKGLPWYFKTGSLIYLSDTNIGESELINAPQRYLSRKFALEKELTLLAREHEREHSDLWQPVVLRKVD